VIEHNRKNFTQAATEMTSGTIKLNPVREGTNPRACAYCPLRAVCAFDPMLKENKYKNIESFGSKEKKDNILSAIKENLNYD